ncbi:MAG: HD domain-containing protein [Clostridiales bacterium]|nr:HD domain-containing protein [Clostridiales bacterium]
MAVLTFAAIDIGSYNVAMEIFEISRKQGIKSIDFVDCRMELGRDTYAEGRISNEMVKKLCQVLNDYKRIMKEYQVSEYRICSTSALREAENGELVLDKIYQNTGMRVHVLGNSEQRFLGYKAIASTEADFAKIIAKGTAVLDIGGGSIQISLFDKDMLITTQNIKLGNLRIRERLMNLESAVLHYETLVEEFIRNEMISFKKLHLKDRKIENVILIGDYTPDILVNYVGDQRVIKKEQFLELYQKIVSRSPIELAMFLNTSLENASLLIPTAIIYRYFMDILGADTIWAPGTQLTDGIAYDYAEKMKMIRSSHNFENDIAMAVRNIGKRYGVSKSHVQMVAKTALTIFDSTKKIHGMGPRERLLLECAVYLHDCGKYISLVNMAECNYHIIMATEIIGISHREREMIAQTVRMNTLPVESFDSLSKRSDLGLAEYLIVNKLVAILRLANGMDRSHLQKIQQIKAVVHEEELRLNLVTNQDYTLEQGLLSEKIDFFEDVFGIRPVFKVKRSMEGGR